VKQFEGFPAKMNFTPIPNLLFSKLLPQISDIAELKTTLHIIALLYQKRGYPQFVTYNELSGNESLLSSLKEAGEVPEARLKQALTLAVERGTVIRITLEREGSPQEIYLLNNEPNRQASVKIQNGEIKLGGLKPAGKSLVTAEELPDIFTLYEENIGMLTPMIAEELRAAEKTYPGAWISEAIKEAVNHNKRKWSYVSAILENWATEGRNDGTHRRYTEKTDPNKYIKGKYGHLVQH
jgi:DnaD/phage-associated family protein